MRTLQLITARLRQSDEGQDLIEYALLTGLIALVAYVGVSSVGSAVMDSFWAVIAAAIPK
jgi:Flp pilus assembly pilin Flp